ncbi:cystathionine beta-lyase [Bradyrhizobium sp. 190]|uniref:cystathionine beta-lyase n=1 Tax=unclassified Bradyrhizobium TaxID=2631580 RepID=UPI001FFB77C2|nr:MULTISPECIES: cystathionine beta-lyase [unclassified Bradyrhizobium]MCK1516136.1 cystathionine beta-lyase [Bradyrhizobium sp. 190]UPK05612.1 cystathionine beta-lyase [Bradyrhizobium sp. 170]
MDRIAWDKRLPEPNTQLSHLGRAPAEHAGMVNVPVYRGSTIVSENLEEWDRRKQNPVTNYGRFGSPLSRALEAAICELEGGYRSILFPSGLSACSHALLGILKAGDHVLICDNVYEPVRMFANQVLTRFEVKVEYFHPTQPSDLLAKIGTKTRAVYLESPGSMTFEVQDLPALCAIAHQSGALVLMDNTWATPLYFKPFLHDVDISIHAATKYIVGHSDALLGIATANKEAWPLLQPSAHHFGEIAGPDDIYLALRGLRTLAVRMRQHYENGLKLAQSLEDHPAVGRVLHPALPSHPGYNIWKRDFLGASGLFGVVLKPMSKAQLSVFFQKLRLFGIGLSWGGYESLVLPVDDPQRTEAIVSFDGPLIRIHAGIEGPSDLIADMHQALQAACEHSVSDDAYQDESRDG